MVLGCTCEPALNQLVGRPLRDGPRFQNARHLEPEIVMEMAGRVFLNNEAPPPTLAARTRFRLRRGLLRDGEVSLAAVLFECFRSWGLLRRGRRVERLGQLLLQSQDLRPQVADSLNPLQCRA